MIMVKMVARGSEPGGALQQQEKYGSRCLRVGRCDTLWLNTTSTTTILQPGSVVRTQNNPRAGGIPTKQKGTYSRKGPTRRDHGFLGFHNERHMAQDSHKGLWTSNSPFTSQKRQRLYKGFDHCLPTEKGWNQNSLGTWKFGLRLKCLNFMDGSWNQGPKWLVGDYSLDNGSRRHLRRSF